ncbi:MAG: phenylacetate--CoA ligase family protein [Herpetosiphonaceae bacterium]|nr:phenylacetate--CoA ligase family protein [Herpetosiphonaceae bacterium]
MIDAARHFARQIYLTANLFRLDRLAPAALASWQLQRLQTMVAHAYTQVPFHQRRMQAAGVGPHTIRSLADLAKLPTMTKADVSAATDLLATGYDETNSLRESTSGSSGQRLQMYHDFDAYDFYTACTYRQYAESGYRPWHRRAYFRWMAFPRRLPTERFGLLRRYFVPISASPEEQLASLLECRPDLICAYPSTLLTMVRTLPASAIASIKPRMIEVNSEHISADERALLEQRFGCPTFNEYSSFELYSMAFECRHRRMHVVAENIILEILNPAGDPAADGETGEIVVTGLHNRAMPFIRYRTGDLAIASSERCPCGRSHPVIKDILGRRDDHILLAGGRSVSPFLLTGIMLALPQVREYQIEQQTLDRVVVSVITRAAGAERQAFADAIKQKIRAIVDDPGIVIEVQFVATIGRGATGKRRNVVVSPDIYQEQASVQNAYALV